MSADPRRLLAGLAVLLLPAQPLPAAEPAPITIEADHWEADQARGLTVYSGNVILTRGNVRVTADEARLLMQEGRLQHATLIGSPAIFRQEPAAGPALAGQARRLEYDAGKETATLTGEAFLRQGSDTIRAASIFVDLAAEKVIAESDRVTPERVRVTLTPRGEPADQSTDPEDPRP